MGLDACVYCNCIETGRVRSTPPVPARLFIDEDGSPSVEPASLEERILHNQWLASSACEHENCWLVWHHLGNIWFIALMREIVKHLVVDVEDHCPILWLDVIYSGTHTGDYLTLKQVNELDAEIRYLRTRQLTDLDEERAQYFQSFLGKLEDLIRASQQVNKPIVF